MTADSPQLIAFNSDLISNKIYNTNLQVFTNGFSNDIQFDQNVFGLTLDDFIISNGIALSLTQLSPSNYGLQIGPFSFDSNSVILNPALQVSLPENLITNANGNFNILSSQILSFAIFNPLQNLDVGYYSKPVLVDLDNDDDLDMIAGNSAGVFLTE